MTATIIISTSRGQIRVGTKKGKVDPSFPNFTPIVCLTKSTAYGALGPYLLRNESGDLIENAWQASKVVRQTQYSKQKFPYSDRVIWEWPAEIHVDQNNQLNQNWFLWHNTLTKAKEPIRYPLTFEGRHQTLGCYSEKDCKSTRVEDLLDIPNSRKKIYFPMYIQAVKKEKLYKELEARLNKGENLLLVDVDGPKQESLEYYKQEYKVNDDFIQNDTILITEENLKIMLNDPKHSCGHCYGLAAALLGLEEVMI